MPEHRPLTDDFSRVLSEHALDHLRRGRILRHAALSTSPDALRASLLSRGFSAPEPLLDLEKRAGGAMFPGGTLLGAFGFLNACPSLAPRDLPSMEGERAFPIFGDPEHLAEWESPFAVMFPSGSIGMFDAPHGPVPAFSSLEHFLELLALAPLTDRLHTLRVDAFCGEMLSGLLEAYAHLPAESPWTRAWIGDGVWIREMRLAPLGEQEWGSYRGTFVATERPELLVDLAPLLLDQGHSLGHRGPISAPPEGATPEVSFVDANPELGYRARVRVSAFRYPDGHSFTHRIER
jgi:hypothetical protein